MGAHCWRECDNIPAIESTTLLHRHSRPSTPTATPTHQPKVNRSPKGVETISVVCKCCRFRFARVRRATIKIPINLIESHYSPITVLRRPEAGAPASRVAALLSILAHLQGSVCRGDLVRCNLHLVNKRRCRSCTMRCGCHYLPPSSQNTTSAAAVASRRPSIRTDGR